jgi:hypothetical protein
MKHLSLIALLGLSLAVVGCGDDEETSARTLTVTFQGLGELGSDYVYEGWLITSSGPISTGRFTATTGQTFTPTQADFDSATAYVLTIEPAKGDDPAPSKTHVVAGEFSNNKATLSIASPSALGSDFSTAAGGFILETPTTSDTADYKNGIWFLDPTGAAPAASLTLPTLPAGWAYEGWVVVNGTPASTGRFTSASGADSDGAGPTAGSEAAPPFPGQDLISPAVDLVGAKTVISIEPDPDDSPAPFALKPLSATVTDAGAGAVQTLSNDAAATAITGTATLAIQ